MFSKQLLHSSFVRLSLIAVVLCSITLLGTRLTGQGKVAAAQLEQSSESLSGLTPNASTGEILIATCPVYSTGVQLQSNLAVVVVYAAQCSPASAFANFIVPSDSKKANQVLSIGLTAQASGKTVDIVYDPSDTSGIPPGLQSSYRKIVGIAMH